MVARLMRFQHVRRQIERDPPRWAEIAFAAGYADQPHLNREFRELAGTTPSEFIARQMPGGGIVGDRVSFSFVQDGLRHPRLASCAPTRAERITMTDELRPNIFPALRYRDADAALDFLERAFGADEKAVHRGEDGAVAHAELRLGAGIVMLGQYSEDGFLGGETPRPLSSTVSLYVVIPDPDGHHDTARAAGATVVRELQDTDYGSREYSVRDLEGNLWSFGTYDPYAHD